MWLWEREALEKRVCEKLGKTRGELFAEVTGLPAWQAEAGQMSSRVRAKFRQFMDVEIAKLE